MSDNSTPKEKLKIMFPDMKEWQIQILNKMSKIRKNGSNLILWPRSRGKKLISTSKDVYRNYAVFLFKQ